jgi:hypothetical protein
LAPLRTRVPVPVLVSEVAAPLTCPARVSVFALLTAMVGVAFVRAILLLKVAAPEVASEVIAAAPPIVRV